MKKPISAKGRRVKGHAFERKIAVDFQEMGFDAITKRASRGGDWSTSDEGIDLVGTEPFAVQCKRYADYVPVGTIEEIQTKTFCPPRIRYDYARKTDERACMNCDHLPEDHPEQIPLLLTKKDNGPTMAVLPWEELQKLIRGNFPKS